MELERREVVVIGASAGGIESVSLVLGALGSAFPLPIVIAQHLDPVHESRLVDVLQRRSTLPVRALATVDRLEPGVVYVVPAGHDAELTAEGARLQPHEPPGPTPSIDRLLRSAASAYGEGVVALILSGAGSDGALGASAVNAHGGTLLIEDPVTASYPSMPAAVPESLVDGKAPADHLGELVERLVVEHGVRDDDERALGAILARVRERSGLDFASYKPATIRRRLRQRVASTQTGTLEGYARYLEANPEESARLVDTFLIKVTEFMRDPDLFAFLRLVALPEIIDRTARRGGEVRVWCAGCATGEEAYSIAMLLLEVLGDGLDASRVRIFATDVDADAIARARQGIYAANALANLSPERLARHFTICGDGRFQVQKRVRACVVFGEHDLAQRAPFPQMDLVLCRNVLIYFSSELQQRVLDVFAFALREGGFLSLGRAETVGPRTALFDPDPRCAKVYVRTAERAPVPNLRSARAALRPAGRSARDGLRDASLGAGGAADASLTPTAPTRASLEAMLAAAPFGLCSIDHRYAILEINLAARRLLSIHTPAVGQDLVHLAPHVPHRRLLDLIDGAFRGSAPPPIVVAIEPIEGGPTRHVEIACIVQRGDRGVVSAESALVVVTDVTATIARVAELESTAAREAAHGAVLAAKLATAEKGLADATAWIDRLTATVEASRAAGEAAVVEHQKHVTLGQRLADANRSLAAANEELATTIERLRTANEELRVHREEAQASHEEVETLNEEFQASNEELEALNEELQATIEELSTTNVELETRNRDNAELARTAQAEREKLAATLLSIGDAVFAVDGAGEALFQNRAYDEIIGDASRLRDEAGRPLALGETPTARAARGEAFRMEVCLEGGGKATRNLEAVGHPILGPGSNAGGVVVLRDITDRSLRVVQERFLTLASRELRAPIFPLAGHIDTLVDLLRDGDARAREYATRARQDVQQLAGLVSEMVDVLRLQTGKLRLDLAPCELRSIVARAVATVSAMVGAGAGGGGDAIHFDEGAPISVRGDAARLGRIVEALLRAALQGGATPPRIDVRLRCDVGPEPGAQGEAVLVVEDRAGTLPETELEQLFRSAADVPLGASARAASGMGHIILKEIVAMHGGSVSAAGARGQGTRMTVRLPIDPSAVPAIAP